MIYGRGDVSPGGRSATEWALLQRILNALRERRMVRSALATYQDLGYRTADGQIPAWKLEEILFLDDCLAQARADKAEQERQERLDAVGGRNG